MTDIVRFTWEWNGFVGSPGYTSIYALAATDPEDVGLAFDAFLYAQRARMPDDVHIRLRPEAEVLSAETGIMSSVVPVGAGSAIDGANTGPYSAPSGVCIGWGTGGIVAGRRVRGRTFLVPMSGAFFETNGSLSDLELSGLRINLNDFLTASAGKQVIWSRPRPAPGGIGPDSPGSAHVVTSATVRDRVAVLTSRRD